MIFAINRSKKKGSKVVCKEKPFLLFSLFSHFHVYPKAENQEEIEVNEY
jgi:hypothetical protein